MKRRKRFEQSLSFAKKLGSKTMQVLNVTQEEMRKLQHLLGAGFENLDSIEVLGSAMDDILGHGIAAQLSGVPTKVRIHVGDGTIDPHYPRIEQEPDEVSLVDRLWSRQSNAS